MEDAECEEDVGMGIEEDDGMGIELSVGDSVGFVTVSMESFDVLRATAFLVAPLLVPHIDRRSFTVPSETKVSFFADGLEAIIQPVVLDGAAASVRVALALPGFHRCVTLFILSDSGMRTEMVCQNDRSGWGYDYRTVTVDGQFY